MYQLYNLIEKGDRVKASTVRRLQSESSTGSIESHRVRLDLTISVARVVFDANGSSASTTPAVGDATLGLASGATTPTTSGGLGGGSGGDGATLSISGKVAEENKHVKLGAYHTLDLETHRPVTIWKDTWDAVHLATLSESADVGHRAEVGAVVLGEGTAVVCLLTESMTVVRQRIDVPVPRKRKGLPTSAADKANARFYNQVYTAVQKLLQLPAIRLIILASPGFTKDTVYDYLSAEATRRGDKLLLAQDTKRKLLRIHVNSPHVHALQEVLRSPEVMAQLKDTKFAREAGLLDKFLKMLSSDELRAWYGVDQVMLAAERGAVGALLISDALFRSADPAQRKRFVELTETVKAQGGEVAIFSSMHETGRQLNGLTGMAAILTYPLDIEVVEREEEEAAEDRRKAQAEEPYVS